MNKNEIIDQSVLQSLREIKKQNSLFGVASYPKSEDSSDKRLHESLLRLESRGLVFRAFGDNDKGIWWQAK